MTEAIYPKYRVVRKYDEYHVEVKRSKSQKWTLLTYEASVFGAKYFTELIFKDKKEAVRRAERLTNDAILAHKRNTDTEVVWGPKP